MAPEVQSIQIGDQSNLKDTVLDYLTSIGYSIHEDGMRKPEGDPKTVNRALHKNQRIMKVAKFSDFLDQWEHWALQQFANGNDVDPKQIVPKVIPVETKEDAALFKYASLTWSVPVSNGYGRRVRFLVKDASNNKIIGIFALGDPVFNLGARDKYVGWDRQTKSKQLYNVFDAFVCGAVDPYRQLLAGKLIALLTTSNEVLDLLECRYKNRETHIQQLVKDSSVALITTSSALGRSSIYNRLTLNDRKAFIPVGYTEGYGHFQFPDEIFTQIAKLAKEHPKYRGSSFGDGSNYRIRIIRMGLSMLGLPGDLLKHGIAREVFLAPTASNSFEFLRGETSSLHRFTLNEYEIGEYFKERWAIKRSKSRTEFQDFKKYSLRFQSESLF